MKKKFIEYDFNRPSSLVFPISDNDLISGGYRSDVEWQEILLFSSDGFKYNDIYLGKAVIARRGELEDNDWYLYFNDEDFDIYQYSEYKNIYSREEILGRKIENREIKIDCAKVGSLYEFLHGLIGAIKPDFQNQYLNSSIDTAIKNPQLIEDALNSIFLLSIQDTVNCNLTLDNFLQLREIVGKDYENLKNDLTKQQNDLLAISFN